MTFEPGKATQKRSTKCFINGVRTLSDITTGTPNLNALASIFKYSEYTSEYFQQIRRSQSPLGKHHHPAHVLLLGLTQHHNQHYSQKNHCNDNFNDFPDYNESMTLLHPWTR